MAKKALPAELNLSAELDQERRTVSFDSYDMTVKQLLDMVENKAIDIAPEYQRQFVWDTERQSVFVESVFLGIPIPSLFMATNKDSTWELVDGVQRLCTMINFCGSEENRKIIAKKNPLVLESLEKLESFNGKSFEHLPKSLQLAFQLRPIRVTSCPNFASINLCVERSIHSPGTLVSCCCA